MLSKLGLGSSVDNENFSELISLAPNLVYDHFLTLRVADKYSGLESGVIDEYLKNQPEEYIFELEEFEKINNPFLPANRRAFIFLPAYNENRNLKNLLSQYLNQENFNGTKLDKSLYEVCVVINYPSTSKTTDADHKNLEESIQIVKEFQNYGADNIHFIAKAFPTDLACLGRARKYAMDYSILRISKGTQAQRKKSILISNEGDTLEIPKNYITSYINLFEKHEKHFVQGSIEYPSELKTSFAPLRVFTNFRESVHFGMSIFDKEFKHYDGILPVGRNFAVNPIIASLVGGIDPIKRKGTDDDLVFGSNISIILGNKYKSYHPIPLVTNPRREILIVADLINGGHMDSGKAYSEFHENMHLYNLTIDEVIAFAKKYIPAKLTADAAPTLLNHYFNWVLRSTAMEHLSHIPGFKQVFEDFHTHKIGYWEKESAIETLEKSYLQNLPEEKRIIVEKEIVIDALNWFNYFTNMQNMKFESTYQGIDSNLKGCDFHEQV